MKKADIEKRTEELVLDIIKDKDYELWDVEYVKEGSDYYLRIYVDKPGGINIDDCVEINRAIDPKLDEEDFIEDAYILEVSSPGLTRKLKKDRDYEKSIGKLIHVKLYKAAYGMKEYVGRLEAYDKETVTVDITDSSNKKDKVNEENKTISLDRDNISSARLEFED